MPRKLIENARTPEDRYTNISRSRKARRVQKKGLLVMRERDETDARERFAFVLWSERRYRVRDVAAMSRFHFGDQLGYHANAQVNKAVERCLLRPGQVTEEVVKETISRHLAKYESLRAQLEPLVSSDPPNLKAVAEYRELMKDERRLIGADAPLKVDIRKDPADMTTEEIDALIKKMFDRAKVIEHET